MGCLIVSLIVILLVAISTLFTSLIWSSMVSADCIEKGWPQSEVLLSTDSPYVRGYCVKRIDQTDVVKPLEEIK
jgi:hypothetical protein